MSFVVGTGEEITESELPALEQLVSMGYEYKSKTELNKTRNDFRQVLLYDRLKSAIKKHNPDLDDDGIREALDQIGEERYPHNLPVVDTNEKIRAKLIQLSKSGGLDPVVVTQNFGDGPESYVVKLFDFENPENNDYIVTNQFQLEGLKYPIFPDIVIFVNGIPLVIIECKAPSIPRPIEQAWEKNLTHYQTPQLGYERLFFYNHTMIATCGTLARYGTVGDDINHFARWGSSSDYTEDEIRDMCNGRCREQEILIAGMLSKRNLLDHMQNFVIYDTKNSKRVKLIAKHQQYRAVTKCVKRLKSDDIKDKGGVVWHTQGSGKSYSMLWFATQLMYKFDNPPILIITDRKQLDKQIHETFKQSGFPAPIRAKSGKHLAELLQNPRGKTIMTIIDKFAAGSQIRTNERIICLVDEAHRSQYRFNAESMRTAMPNAVFYAFSGTPIDKQDKSTYRVFGPMLDKYGFRESQADGATLKIRYEGRLPELFVEGDDTIDEIFERVFSGLDSDLKDRLKRQYVTKGAIAEAPSRIKRIALDIVQHYTAHIEPNGYKAMLVAPSRQAAIRYKKELDSLNAPPSKVIMTSSLGEQGKDGELWDKYYLSPEQREQEAEKFKSPDDPAKILIVVDMLLVGYDVPVCQVMYLDKGLREHNLLQAIARVNRPYNEAKSYGLIVDYSGITKELHKALEMFEEQDVEGALDPIDELAEELKSRHKDIMAYFAGINQTNNDEILEQFEPADMRERFEYDFKMFSKVLDAVMPSKEAEPFIDDFKFASKARQLIRTYYEGVRPSTKPYAGKIQKLIDDHIHSLHVSELINPTEITLENFIDIIKSKIKSDRARTALIKNKAIQVIDELAPNNPAYYERLRERLQKIIDEERERRKKNASYFMDPQEYEKIYKEAITEEMERKKVFGNYTATPFEFAIYGELDNILNDKADSINLTKKIYSKIQPETLIIGWKEKTSTEKNLKAILYDTLSENNIDESKIPEVTERIITLAKNRL